MRKKIAILGSTGSIGKTLLNIIEKDKRNFEIVLLTANKNYKTLYKQAKKFNVKNLIITNPKSYEYFKKKKTRSKINLFGSFKDLNKIFKKKIDYVMSSIVGIDGLYPTIQVIKFTKKIAIANKESIICGWNLIKNELKKNKTQFIPVDSEHFSLWYGLNNLKTKSLEKIYITASGGPFYKTPLNKFQNLSVSEALKHPNWKMGKKITIDSATMMNKGLELIEAYHLFPIAEPQIEVLVHPQSVIHSMVEYVDGSVLAQMGTPDMRTPISFAMEWPNRMQTPSPRLSLADIGTLTFELPDCERFPALRLAREALITGRSAPTVLNAVNEVAVQKFIDGKIGFLDIATTIEEALNKIPPHSISSLEDVIEIDAESRAWAIQQS